MRRGLGTSWTSLNVPISESGAPEGEEKEQEIENFFEKIMKENFPNLAKEIGFQEVQEARVPKKLDPRKHTPRHIIITLPKIKEKERILKAPRKRKNYLQRSSHKTISGFLILRNLTGQEELETYSKSRKARVYIQDYSIQQNYHLAWKGR